MPIRGSESGGGSGRGGRGRLPRGWRRWPRVLVTGVALLVTAYLAAAGVLVVVGRHDQVGRADVIVVPGNTVAPDGTPGPRLRARLDAALVLYRQEAAPLVLVSGGTGVEGFDEADAMGDYLQAHGVPAAAVIRDGAGVDTAATAGNTAAVLRARGLRTAIVATQYFHVHRTRLLLERAGVEVTGTRHARFTEPRDVYSTLREVAACAEVYLTG